MADAAEVQVALNAAKKSLVLEQPHRCYCQENAMDHKGPCGHCNALGMLHDLIAVGYRILAMSPLEFSIEAPEYLDCAERNGWGIWKMRERIIGEEREAVREVRERLTQ